MWRITEIHIVYAITRRVRGICGMERGNETAFAYSFICLRGTRCEWIH